MGKSCCAVGCKNRYSKDSGIPFYRFPTDAERRSAWTSAVNRKDWVPNEHSWICGAHFITGCKSNDPVSPDFTPSVFDYVKSPQKRKLVNDIERYDRRVATKRKRMDNTAAASAAASLVALADNDTTDLEPHTESFASTTLSISDIEKLESRTRLLEDENSKLKEENESLKEHSNNLQDECRLLKEPKCMLSQDWFEGSDTKVKYYTGLPNFVTLLAVYNFVAPYIEITNRSVLSRFQQLMIVLIKLRLNLGDQDLAFRFGVNQSTISRCFNKMIHVLYIRLKPLIKWPERSELLKTMPMEFRHHFRSCVTIIDCFEVFIERPTNVKARAQTWSNYKHHNTAKFLIGIAPQGVITFISRGWGGRASDVHITENCGILENLMQGDLILADRGFNIHDSAGLYYAEVKLPPFTKGKLQLSQSDVDLSRQLSRVRIHVERIIGLVRQKYTILQSTIPINLIMCSEETEEDSVIDKIVTVCCALCNCCTSVVSFD